MLFDAKVRDHMTTPLIAVEPTTLIHVAQQLMEDQHFRHLPVVGNGKLVGILSSGDIRCAGPSTTSSLSVWEASSIWAEVTVAEVMCRHVVRVFPDTLVTHAIQLMNAHHFNCLPVVDLHDFPIGIITEVDIFRLFLAAAKQEQEMAKAGAAPTEAGRTSKARVPTEPLPESMG